MSFHMFAPSSTILMPTKTFCSYLQRSLQPKCSKYECQSKRTIGNFEGGEDVTQRKISNQILHSPCSFKAKSKIYVTNSRVLDHLLNFYATTRFHCIICNMDRMLQNNMLLQKNIIRYKVTFVVISS